MVFGVVTGFIGAGAFLTTMIPRGVSIAGVSDDS